MTTSLFLLLAAGCWAQDALPRRADVKQALQYLRANDGAHFAKQIQIAEIAAPTFHEGERAKFMKAEFARVGLKDIEIDKQGNVLGWRPGKSSKALVIAAHLDISFAVGVNVKVRKEGNRYYGPGLGDDSRGLTAILAIVEALNAARIETQKTLLFVANVGEEGLGDLIGVKYLFKESPHRGRLDSFISIDGVNPARIANGGTGVKRYRMSYRTPGGHSYGNFGRPSAIHAAGRLVGKMANWEVPQNPKTTYNAGKIEGGTTINAIAEECSIEVDLRSENPGELDKLELRLLSSAREGASEENAKRAASGLEVKMEAKLIGYRPAGVTSAENPLVKAAEWASKATGHAPSLGFGSTDSNLPISLGIPAVTLGGGGKGDSPHSLREWYEPVDAYLGPQMVLLTILAYDANVR